MCEQRQQQESWCFFSNPRVPKTIMYTSRRMREVIYMFTFFFSRHAVCTTIRAPHPTSTTTKQSRPTSSTRTHRNSTASSLRSPGTREMGRGLPRRRVLKPRRELKQSTAAAERNATASTNTGSKPKCRWN